MPLFFMRLKSRPRSVTVVITLDEVSSSMVDRSSTCRAAAIWDRRRSSFRSFCRSPVRCASSTISVPKWLKALTNSVKLLTPSNRPRLWDTWKNVGGWSPFSVGYSFGSFIGINEFKVKFESNKKKNVGVSTQAISEHFESGKKGRNGVVGR